MTVGSLFSGIGGLELGLERAGMETIWQVEKNDFCKQILDKHWPEVPTYGDITTIDFRELERPDVICGGFPCTDISTAGTREGLQGERSGLWSEFFRCVRELRPCYAVVENVTALRSNGLGRVLGDLAEIGYDAEWNCLPSGTFGAPHRRDRIFVVAYPSGKPDAQTITSVSAIRKVRYARDYDDRSTWRGKPRTHGQISPPEVCGVDGRPPRFVDRMRAIGNIVVPQVAEFVGRCVMRHRQESTT